jgi:hypothetical protein
VPVNELSHLVKSHRFGSRLDQTGEDYCYRLNCVPKHWYVEIPVSQNVNLFGNDNLEKMRLQMQLIEMRPYWSKVGF